MRLPWDSIVFETARVARYRSLAALDSSYRGIMFPVYRVFL